MTTAELRQHLLREAQWELIPLKSLAAQLAFLPADSPVSITASAAKTLEDTVVLAEELLTAGHRPVPHIAARMIASHGHLEDLLGWIDALGLHEIFLVGGDAPEPAGPYHSAVVLLEALDDAEHTLTHIGVTSYPEGHAAIADGALHEALHAKQALLAGAGIEGHASTQMCFHAPAIKRWLESERDSGLTLPVHLGIPGAVDRARLLRISARLGVGASLRYLRKNSGAVARLARPGGYNPSRLLKALMPDAHRLNIAGLHVFTFNAIEHTVAWRNQALASPR